MGRRSREKKGRRNTSTLEQHRRIGKTLQPPFAQVLNLKPSSWYGERLPELLWTILIVSFFDRDDALAIFRRVADYIFRLPEDEKFADVTHSGLASLRETQLAGFLECLFFNNAVNKALAPLLLLPDLPAYERWSARLSAAGVVAEWPPLMSAVANAIDHQSQAATDCRWMRVLAMRVAGAMHLPPGDLAQEIALYPNYGDMREVQPSIRATEICFAPDVGEWPSAFWQHCFSKTPCWSMQFESAGSRIATGYTATGLGQVRHHLIDHCQATVTTTSPDPRHDTVFGLALYSLAIAEELLRVGNSSSILARVALRTIVECYVTLAYLLAKNSAELWSSFRAYGSGQAKLAFLKLDDSSDEPSYVDIGTLQQLANEDVWQEFLPINVGHWDGSNLRALSEAAGVKDVYDKFYPWTSSFTHGHWGAIRDSVYDTCGNPLHRLHRIPRVAPRVQPDVVPDVAEVVDCILVLVNTAFPGFTIRLAADNGPRGIA